METGINKNEFEKGGGYSNTAANNNHRISFALIITLVNLVIFISIIIIGIIIWSK